MQIFVNSVENLNSPVYSAPPCTCTAGLLFNRVSCVVCTLPVNGFNVIKIGSEIIALRHVEYVNK